jgi:hypothetical protein
MNDCYVARNPIVAARAIGDTVVIMSADSELFTLNEVASVIWNAADGFTPLSQIVEKAVCANFDIDLAIAKADAEKLVTDLSRHGVLLVSAEPISKSDPR